MRNRNDGKAGAQAFRDCQHAARGMLRLDRRQSHDESASFRFTGITDAVQGQMDRAQKSGAASLTVFACIGDTPWSLLFHADCPPCSPPDAWCKRVLTPFAEWLDGKLATADRLVLWTCDVQPILLDPEGGEWPLPGAVATAQHAALLPLHADATDHIARLTAGGEILAVLPVRNAPSGMASPEVLTCDEKGRWS